MNYSSKQTLSVVILVGVFLSFIPLFQNFTATATQVDFENLRDTYLTNLGISLDTWETQDLNTYSTGHICKSTSVSQNLNSNYEGKPYITAKISALAELLKNLGVLFQYVDQKKQAQIIRISTKIYHYLYDQIDWGKKLIRDDYGLCYKGISTSYSFFSTPETVMGMLAFYKILSPEDSNYSQLKNTISMLSEGHLKSADSWLTPIDIPVTNGSSNYMAYNLSVLRALNEVDPTHSYFNLLQHRLVTDYAWIKASWISNPEQQICGMPLLYGGWSHQTPQEVSRANNFTLECSYFDQSNALPLAQILRSYYLQKTSYHSIITEGLLNLRKVLFSRDQCSIHQDLCAELDSILKGSTQWTLEMMKNDGSISTAFKSYSENEFGYFEDIAGNRPGIKSLMETIEALYPMDDPLMIIYRLGFPNQNINTSSVSLSDYKEKIYRLLDYEVRRSRTVIDIGRSYFLAAKRFKKNLLPTTPPAPVVIPPQNGDVIELYNTVLDHYFITSNSDEADQVEHGKAGPGWIRTGYAFKSGGTTPVCRFYGSLNPGPNSHFYTVSSQECSHLKELQAQTPNTQKRWNFESEDFRSTPPIGGDCYYDTVPIYRAYNNGNMLKKDSNHRITSSWAAIQEVLDRGWIYEGIVMCAPK